MSLFKSNCILKSDGVVFKGVKPLKTTATVKTTNNEEAFDESEILKVNEEIEEQLHKAKDTCENMISNAQVESERIVQEAQNECEEIKKKAYEEGHNIGLRNGYEDGYKESYEDNIEKAKQESEEIINKSNNILLQANEQFTDFLKDSKKDIISLSVSIAEKVLKEKFKDEESMNNILESTIKEYEIKENFVIRTNAIYIEKVNEQLNELKNQQLIKGESFILADDFIEPGNAIIETNKGRLIVGIDCVLEKVKEELL
ncbi:FliH/SctL family protein [Paraclostridium bifermentans]|uniref:FliH/SctL family protein n=1 Tax=Paraclostridium bifermentans TaxID=1490 RepID=UPI001C827DE5|nr:FliH/SctL family protein [Paraclostridium bifermentans]GIM32898.1 flagellar assembly protein FliH [Paraclostridium bifermentans subsp. muricolitidis]